MPDGEPFFDDCGQEHTYDEIRKLMDVPYWMQLVGEEAEAVKAAVNIGIDAHLEACYVPELGDRFEVRKVMVNGVELTRKLDCHISKQSMPVLLRRLFESDNERAWQLGHDIIDTLRGED